MDCEYIINILYFSQLYSNKASPALNASVLVVDILFFLSKPYLNDQIKVKPLQIYLYFPPSLQGSARQETN